MWTCLVRIPVQTSLHVHDRAWFLEQCLHAGKGCAQPAMQGRARKQLSAGVIKGDQRRLKIERTTVQDGPSELGEQLV